MKYWLMKSEPDVFGLDDLKRVGSESWDGVRNYQARNFMREMKEGDLVLFYHSNCKPPGVAGMARIVGEARPDPTQFDPDSDYHDPKSSRDEPRWDLVDVGYVEHFARLVPLAELKEQEELAEMAILRRGNRLSVTPVTQVEFEHIRSLGSTSVT